MRRSFAQIATGLLVAVTISGCATPYQEMGFLGGVDSSQIDATTLRISARGNSFTDVGQIRDYVMLKAAEETLAHGYDMFLIVAEHDATEVDTFSTPQSHDAPVQAMGFGPRGPISVIGTATYTTTSTSTITSPGQDTTIKMYRGVKPAGAPLSLYVAREVVAFMAPRLRKGAMQPDTSIAPQQTAVIPATPAPSQMAVNTAQPSAPPAVMCSAERYWCQDSKALTLPDGRDSSGYRGR
jgi:hypothetical protein